MNRSDIVRGIALKTSLNQQEAREALDALIELLAMSASFDEDVTIAGFGKFTVRNRKPARRRNPLTGDEVDVPARKALTFKASQSFRDKI